jgi:hypothetical protein
MAAAAGKAAAAAGAAKAVTGVAGAVSAVYQEEVKARVKRFEAARQVDIAKIDRDIIGIKTTRDVDVKKIGAQVDLVKIQQQEYTKRYRHIPETVQRIINQSDENITSLDVPFHISSKQKRGQRKETRFSPLFVMMLCGLVYPLADNPEVKTQMRRYGESFLLLTNQMQYLQKTAVAGSMNWAANGATDQGGEGNNDLPTIETQAAAVLAKFKGDIYAPANLDYEEAKKDRYILSKYFEALREATTDAYVEARSSTSESGERVSGAEQTNIDNLNDKLDDLSNKLRSIEAVIDELKGE